jgi:hypothetical protein
VAFYFLVSAVWVVSFTPSANAQTSSYGELQGAYMFNFAKYIKWPGEIKQFTIGIYGKSDFIETWQNTLASKKIGGRDIALREISKLEDLGECNIVYVPEAESKKISEIRAAVSGKNVLIVTEEDQIKKGATISFVVEDDRLRFKIKKSLLTEAGLVASEGLLKIAIEL